MLNVHNQTSSNSIKCIMCPCAFGYWYCSMLGWGFICLFTTHLTHSSPRLAPSHHTFSTSIRKNLLTTADNFLCSATHVYLLNCNVGKIMGNKIYWIYVDNRWWLYVISGHHLLTTLLSDNAMTARLHFKHAEVRCRSWGLTSFFVSFVNVSLCIIHDLLSLVLFVPVEYNCSTV